MCLAQCLQTRGEEELLGPVGLLECAGRDLDVTEREPEVVGHSCLGAGQRIPDPIECCSLGEARGGGQPGQKDRGADDSQPCSLTCFCCTGCCGGQAGVISGVELFHQHRRIHSTEPECVGHGASRTIRVTRPVAAFLQKL